MLDTKIRVEQGLLEGFTSKTSNGFEYNAYFGIPFAEPPVGDLRFRDPLPPGNWEGMRKADKYGDRSCQSVMFDENTMMGSDDCLYLNIWAPTRNSGNKLPVMVSIHGGGFFSGSGEADLNGPDHFLERDVLFVSMNYRLGPLGFLCLHTSEVPGNAGMKDIVMSLRWIQKNIAQFGGDPSNVTIFGVSAGSAAVNYLMISEMSKSLFKRAIMQSGSSLCSWAQIDDPEQVAFNLCKTLGLETTDKQEVLEYLRSVPVEKLIKAATERLSFVGQLKYVPVIEKVYPDVEALINASPLEIMESGTYDPKPLINGFTSKEGMMFLSAMFCESPKFFVRGETSRYAETAAKMILRKTEVSPEIVKKVEDFYFPEGGDVVAGFIELISVGYFGLSAVQTAEKFSRKCKKTFLYNFAYFGGSNMGNLFLRYPFPCASHGDDIAYLYKMNMFPFNEGNETDVMMRDRMVSMWTNFAKCGNPTPTKNNVITEIWKPFTENERCCLKIDKNMDIITDLYNENSKFWNELALSMQ